MLRRLWPYVVAGVVVAAALGAALERRLWRLPRGVGAGPGGAAGWVALGMLSPVCTFAIVPLAVELARGGTSAAGAVGFVVASFAINPQVFTMVLGAAGVKVALVYAAGVFLFSTGFALLAGRAGLVRGDAAPAPNRRSHGMTGPFGKDFLWRLLDLGGYVGVYFLLGLIAASILGVFAGPAALGFFRSHRMLSVPLAGLAALPGYFCAGASIPFVEMARRLGASSGTLLAFILAGPGTRISALVGLSAILTKRGMAAYLAAYPLFAVVLGYVVDLLPAGGPG